MAPFEPLGDARGACHKRLHAALEKAKTGKPAANTHEAAIVTAYRKTKASKERYPNSAELLRAAIGEGKLSGGITETCPKKHERLAECWSGSKVKTRNTSWRKEIECGVLARPKDLSTPWLFSMDPMTYSENGDEDDDKLHRFDLRLIGPALRLHFGSGQPGVAAIFVYGLGTQKPNPQRQFSNFMAGLRAFVADGLPKDGIAHSLHRLPHRGGNRNFAGLLYTGVELSFDFQAETPSATRPR